METAEFFTLFARSGCWHWVATARIWGRRIVRIRLDSKWLGNTWHPSATDRLAGLSELRPCEELQGCKDSEFGCFLHARRRGLGDSCLCSDLDSTPKNLDAVLITMAGMCLTSEINWDSPPRCSFVAYATSLTPLRPAGYCGRYASNGDSQP